MAFPNINSVAIQNYFPMAKLHYRFVTPKEIMYPGSCHEWLLTSQKKETTRYKFLMGSTAGP